MLACVLALSLVGAPFEDIHRRFIIELPEGWQYAPLPGDDGATFRKASPEGALGNFNIGVLPRTAASLEETVRSFARHSESEPGYRELSRGRHRGAAAPLRHPHRRAHHAHGRGALRRHRAARLRAAR